MYNDDINKQHNNAEQQRHDLVDRVQGGCYLARSIWRGADVDA